MNETHYTQIKEAHKEGRTLMLKVSKDTIEYCKPSDSVTNFITKCKIASKLGLDFSVSSGIEGTTEDRLKNLLDDMPDDMPQELKDILKDMAIYIPEDDKAEDEDICCSDNSSDCCDEATEAKIAVIDGIYECLNDSGNRIITEILDMKATIIKYHHLTPNMRACTITLPTGHEVIGVAQVLSADNDVEKIGNEVALKNATEEIRKVIGDIAKTIMDPSDG